MQVRRQSHSFEANQDRGIGIMTALALYDICAI